LSYEEIITLDKKLKNPSSSFKTIHVAGTNGKGTVCLNIARNLENQGYKVGLFISPHFEDICERISINQTLIDKKNLYSIYKEHETLLKDLSFFELMTFISFLYFKENKVDFAVIEVGIGGLEDTTNIINPILSVITSISLDHQDILGATIEEIAAHKAGIIKYKTPVVLGVSAQIDVCIDKALEKDAKIIKVEKGENDYLKENKKICDAALKELGIKPADKIYNLPARFEVYGNIIFDMAHNISGFNALKNKIEKISKGKKVIAIWNMSRSKDIKGCLQVLKSFTDKVYFYPFTGLLTEENAHQLGLEIYNDQIGDITLVCGSIYFLSTLKADFANKKLLQLL
jgi:dihydrofolate synthase/folylpolyglutamate synthase